MALTAPIRNAATQSGEPTGREDIVCLFAGLTLPQAIALRFEDGLAVLGPPPPARRQRASR